jgi:hypothetical protein
MKMINVDELLADLDKDLLTDSKRKMLDLGEVGFATVDTDRKTGAVTFARFVSFTGTPSEDLPFDSKLVGRVLREGVSVW